MEISEYRTYKEAEILPLYESVGWTAYTDQPEVLRKGFENSLLTLAAYEGDQLLGIIHHSCRRRWIYRRVCSGYFGVPGASAKRHRHRTPQSPIGWIQPCTSD